MYKYKATFQGCQTDKNGKAIKYYPPFTEVHRSIEDIQLRSYALNWFIISIEEL